MVIGIDTVKHYNLWGLLVCFSGSNEGSNLKMEM